MPTDFAYMTSAKNLGAILERVRDAGTPPKFTLDFLKSLGYTSSTDRPVIGVLKALGFLSPDGVPTERYNMYRDGNRSRSAMTTGLREGWSGLLLVDQRAFERSPTQLTELFKSASGKGEAVAKKMATTFRVLSDMADWSASESAAPQADLPNGQSTVDLEVPPPTQPSHPAAAAPSLRLHHDVHVHLPSTSDVSVYTAIFRALKAELLD